MDKQCCSQCCGVLSSTGVVFLVLIGILLKKQPLYIKDVDDPSKAADNCFIAAGLYAFLAVLCFGYLTVTSSKRDTPTGGDEREAAGIKAGRMSNYGSGSGPSGDISLTPLGRQG